MPHNRNLWGKTRWWCSYSQGECRCKQWVSPPHGQRALWSERARAACTSRWYVYHRLLIIKLHHWFCFSSPLLVPESRLSQDKGNRSRSPGIGEMRAGSFRQQLTQLCDLHRELRRWQVTNGLSKTSYSVNTTAGPEPDFLSPVQHLSPPVPRGTALDLEPAKSCQAGQHPWACGLAASAWRAELSHATNRSCSSGKPGFTKLKTFTVCPLQKSWQHLL